MTLESKHSLLLSNLCDQLSTSVDGTGIMDGSLSSRSTRNTDQLSAADKDDVALIGQADVPKDLICNLVVQEQV